ncbi:hypothetical protein ARALYDRAFT_892576 [Arabidopsis lyrata subsp. lyrata]|uniref:F-box associated beta-propeller type 3 domain-containing protein n=1 Tax=Arabidopsis lyrata subsp. lyrata TaxID=81972 RepID=D7KN15_ARALL|nr:hypothetical protein ARALYDRAFT_892576 [Arabidopsis lyrata subsp. lyrata]
MGFVAYQLFLTKSVARPRLLFTFKANKELHVFSSPQPQSPDGISSLVATPYKSSPYKSFPKYFPTDICTSHCGLVFLQHRRRKARVICNPVTGESITLPKLKGRSSYFGFDPISKHFKVLCMTENTHWILILETGKRLWRTIQDPVPSHSFMDDDGIFINGILYYMGYFGGLCLKIVCFDFRLEKFGVVKLDKDMQIIPKLTLFNCKGKLGVHQHIGMWCEVKSFALWVLEDAGEHKWSKRIFILPSIVRFQMFVGMTGTGEIVFSPCKSFQPNPFYIFFYNIERNTVTRIHIQGFEEFEHHRTSVQTILNFVEDVKFI